MSGPNIFDFVNQAIFEFVQKPENRSLMAGTGAYSTPFRGRLFGYSEISAVVKQLETRNVEVLWFGSNPNVPQSIAQIIDPRSGKSDFYDFERQMSSGAFSHCFLDKQGHATPAWDPKTNWGDYRDVLQNVADIDCVAMANFIPWGSENLDALVEKLGVFDPELLRRVVGFADALSYEIVKWLRPGLVVVPFSVGVKPRLDRTQLTGLSKRRGRDLKEHPIRLDGKRWRSWTGTCALGVRAVWVPHHSSLHYMPVDAKQRLLGELSEVLL